MLRILAILFVLQVNAENVVDLVIRETAGVVRAGEDVTMGVPLAEGSAYTDETRFALKDALGNTLPCEFKVLSTWWRDTTAIRWLQLNFPFSLAAGDSETVRLSYESAPAALASNLTVQDQGAYFEVNTGQIRFQVKKANFNLIDQAWVDESGSEAYGASNQVVASHSRGLVFFDSLDTEYLSSNDAASTVTLDRQGPGMVILTARGVLKSAGGTSLLHFICRIYAFNNSASVRVYSTVENWNPNSATYVGFAGLQAEIPLNLGATRTATVSKPGGYETSVLSGSGDLFCMVKRPAGTVYSMGSAIEGSIGGAKTGSFNPKALTPRDIGWVALSDGARGCVAAMKYFWQMVPASVEAFGDGKLLLGLFSKRSGITPNMFYAGAARTYETRYTFFNSLTNDQIRSRAVSTTDRLFAVADAKYYSRDAAAAFPMLETPRSGWFVDTLWNWVSEWETKLNSVWEQVLDADDNLFGYDSYGFLEWGDNPHYDESSYAFPWRILWNGNYYGLPFFAFEHFFHNRDARFLEYGIAHSRHVQDIHLVHFGPVSQATGGSHYSPPAYHFSTDDDPTVTSGTFTIDNPSHHMVECLFLDYYLTGNDYALEVGMQGADWFNRFGTTYAYGDNLATYIRRWAHQMYSQVWAWQHTRAAKYYNCLWQNWEVMKTDIRTNATIGQPFMIGFGMEAVVKMYGILSPTYRNLSGVQVPDSIPYYLKTWADRVKAMSKGTGSTQVNGNASLGMAFLAPFYGRVYQRAAAACASTLPNPPGNLHKDFAQQYRNIEMAMLYMAKPESVGLVVDVEKGPEAGPASKPLALAICPSPFNPVSQIRIQGDGIWKGTLVEISVFAPDGRLVQSWSEASRGFSHVVEWNAADMASGVYMVECRAAGMTARARAVLVR